MWPVLPQVEPPTFEYAVVDSCPAEAEARSLFPSAPGRTRVVAWFDGRTYGGMVAFVDPERGPAERTLNGPTCAIVLEALALSMGVAVESAHKPPPVTAAAPSVDAPEPAPPPDPDRASASFLRGVDLGIGTWLGAQPRVPLTASLMIVVGSTREERRIWAPRLRLGYAASFPTSAHEAAFYSFVVRLDACPIELGGRRLVFSPCIRQDTGVLATSVALRPRARSEFVASTGVSALTQLRFQEGGRWYVQAEIAGLFPWRHLEYGPSFEIAPVVGQFALSVGASTP